VLALSAFDDPARRVELLRSGANDYVSKPILEEELIARVGNLIRAKRLFDQVKAQQRNLEKLAVTDPLTGLYNRHYLATASKQQVANSRRHEEPLSLIVLDLDHFKRINDEHGHSRGDLVLTEVGQVLGRTAREGDICARIGGEEFVIVLTRCSLEGAVSKARQVRSEIEGLRPAGLTVTASLGVATFDRAGDADFDGLFKRADDAAYRAKRSGRNRVEISTPDDRQSSQSSEQTG
jgi:two-component system cell cycle response regulator